MSDDLALRLSAVTLTCYQRAVASPVPDAWRDLAAISDVVRRLVGVPSRDARGWRDPHDGECAWGVAKTLNVGATAPRVVATLSPARRRALAALSDVADELADTIATHDTRPR